MKRCAPFLLILMVLLSAAPHLGHTDPAPPQAIATLSEAPVLDGVLEPLWKQAPPISAFHQLQPDEGGPVRQRTEVYILYSRDALYVGFDCHDTHPDSIVGRIQRRDNNDHSDWVVISLDTFHDLRNAYVWCVTAGGVQFDGTYHDESEAEITWDGIWESAVRRNAGGWVAELRIPFQSFRHNGGDGVWGMNLERWVERYQEEDTWAPLSRARGERVGEWGTLAGLHDIASARHIEVLPHVIGRIDPGSGSRLDSLNTLDNLGVDVKVVPSSSWTVDLTYQPDFAQVDVDNEVINLSDYPVFLEEKRPFFLEGQDLFSNMPYTLLYTRKIADPDVGGRVTGQWGHSRATLLYAINRSEEQVAQNAFAGRIVSPLKAKYHRVHRDRPGGHLHHRRGQPFALGQGK